MKNNRLIKSVEDDTWQKLKLIAVIKGVSMANALELLLNSKDAKKILNDPKKGGVSE